MVVVVRGIHLNLGSQSKFSNVVREHVKYYFMYTSVDFTSSISLVLPKLFMVQRKRMTHKNEIYILENIHPSTLHTYFYHSLSWKFFFLYSFKMFEIFLIYIYFKILFTHLTERKST